MTKRIYHQFFFPQEPALVWEYLTTAELMQQWLMPNNFMPILGYDFEFRIKPVPQLDIDGIIYCKVLEIVPCERLSYSWKSGPGNGQITLDSVVFWTLTPQDNGTALVLEHSGFKEIENSTLYAAMNDGWQKNVNKIPGLLNIMTNGDGSA